MSLNFLSKGVFLILVTIGFTYPSYSQVVIHQQGFEGATDYNGYSTSGLFMDFNDAANADHFLRGDCSTKPVAWDCITNFEGAAFLFWEDTDGEYGEVSITLDPVNIAGFSDLTIGWGVAAPKMNPSPNVYDSNDFMILEYKIDAGAWTKVGECRGDNASNGRFRHDDNNDGTTISQAETLLTGAMQYFTYNIAATGSSMEVRVRFNSGNQEEMALDNLVISGERAPEIPTLSEWGLFNLALLLMICGTLHLLNQFGIILWRWKD